MLIAIASIDTARRAWVVLARCMRRARRALGDRLVDIGVWLASDDETRRVEASLAAWGREEREGWEHPPAHHGNGRALRRGEAGRG